MENRIILVVGHHQDDEMDMLVTLVQALEDQGITVYGATSEEVAPEFEEANDGIQDTSRN